MALTTTLIKNDRQRAVAYLNATVAGDSATVTLLSLRRTDEIATSTTSNLAVNIAHVACNVGTQNSAVTIRRNNATGTVVLVMFAQSEFPVSQQLPSIATENTSNLHVTFETPGNIFLDLKKVAGYAGPDTNVGV